MNNLHLIVSKDSSYNAAIAKKIILEHSIRHEAVDNFDARTLDTFQLKNTLYSNSLISNKRCIIINNAHLLKPDVIELIIQFANAPQPDAVLIMISEDTDEAKKRLVALNSMKSITRHISANQTTYALIQNYIKTYNIKITKPAIDMLVNILEVSTWGIIENELNKLSTYAGKNGVIDEDAVAEITFNINRADTFKFVNELLAQKEKSAFEDLKKLKEAGSEIAMITGAILWKIRQLLSDPSNQVDTLIKRIELIYNYTLALRSGKLNNNIILDMLTIELLHEKPY
jgi:DNA polymerase III delta subunit